MLTIDNIYDSLIEINKSKFYSFAYPVSSEDECKEILLEFRKKYRDATHICFAYVLTSPGLEKASDDGEPQGTAGRPILEVLRKKKLVNILVIVVRYFGGIKLGAGGLIRAYTESCNEVVSKCNVVDKKEKKKFTLTTTYDIYPKLLNTLKTMNVDIMDSVFEDKVVVKIESEEDVDNINMLGVEIDGDNN